MSSPFWVKFPNGAEACVEEVSLEAAKNEALRVTGADPVEVKTLPYPAYPRLGRSSGCPSFCMSPRECAGRKSCPRRPSTSKPRPIGDAWWHLPYVSDDEIPSLNFYHLVKISAARCARVSYLTHDAEKHLSCPIVTILPSDLPPAGLP